MDPISTDGTDQTSQDTKLGANGATEGGESQVINDANSVQSEGQDNADDTNLPPELLEVKKSLLRDYHEKTQKLASKERELDGQLKDFKWSHELLAGLKQEPWFQKAYQDEKARREGRLADEELNEDQFEKIKSDPRAFREYIQRFAERVGSKYEAPLSNAHKELQFLKQEQEFEVVAKKHPELRQLRESGALDQYRSKGHDWESAFALHKLRNGGKSNQTEILKEAERLLAAKRAGAVDRSGTTSVKGVKVIQANNLMDALDKAFDAAEKGDTNFKFERTK
jgi:hypothetical protein